MNTEEKVMIGVGVTALVVLAGVMVFESSKTAAAAPKTVTPQPAPDWIEVTGKDVTMPAGATVALSYANPTATIASELEALATAPASQATGVHVYPVGTLPPLGFPLDGAEKTAFRVLLILTEAVPSLTIGSLPAIRVWYHT